MRGALRQNQAEANDPSEELARAPWFLEVVSVGAHDIQKSLVSGRQEVAAVEHISKMNQAFVGDCFHPLQRKTATRVIKDDFTIYKGALSNVIGDCDTRDL